MSNIVIDIAAEFTGKKAFNDTEKAVMKISKGAKKLAAAFGLAFGTRAILAYSKASMKASAADQKSQYLLTTNLKNLGLAYANVDTEAFIKSMETQTHIADDLLRPAYAQLAQQTGSIAMTQKIMATAFDTANGAGLDFAETVNILSLAYVGNRKGLKQLKIGLTQAQLAGLSFDELLTTLNKHFSGAGAAAVKGYAGQMDALNITLGNVQEILGGALLDSFAKMAGGGDISKATSKVEKFAEAWAGVLKVLTGVYDIGAILNQVEFGGFLGIVPKDKPASSIPMQSPGDRAAINKANAKQLAVQKELAKLAKAQAAAALATAKAKKDQAALDNAALALAKGTDIFNIDAIQIQAAIMAKAAEINKLGVSATDQQKLQIANDLARLNIKQDMLVLEDAIAAKDVAGAAAAVTKLNRDISILGVLSQQNLKLADLNKIYQGLYPKDLINISNLDQALALLLAMSGIQTNQYTPGASGEGGTIGLAESLKNTISVSAELALLQRKNTQLNTNYVDTSNSAINPTLSSNSTNVVNNNVTVNGAVDPVGTANYLKQLLSQAANQVGSYQDWAQAYKGQSYQL